MICEECGEVIQEGQEYYNFDGIAVCKDCIYDFLTGNIDSDDNYVIGEDKVTEDEIFDYLFDHLEVYEKPDDDPRYEPEYWER